MSKSTISWVSDVAAWLTAAPIRDTDGALAPTARWNQLARRANLQRGPDDWLIRLERYRARCVDDLERLRRTADESKPGRLPWVEAEIGQVDELMKFAGQLVQFARQTLQTANWSGYAQHARGQLEQLLGDRNAFAVYASGEDDLELARWDDVQLLLTELSWLDDLDQATPERFASAARRELERPTGHHGRVGDGVYVGPLHSAVGMHWDVVYIVGVTERSLPQPHSEDSLLSEQVRLRASLPVATDYIRRERANYLVALHSAERRVLSYPRADVRAQRAKLPSRWLLESATELNAGVRVYASKIDQAPPGVIRAVPSFEQAVTSADMPADIHEFDLKSLRRSVQPQDHYLAAFSAPLGRGFLQHDERRRPALTRWDGLIADGVASVVSQPQSAGALQDWATCPYRYFLGRVLRIAERDESRDELQITPVDKGSLIHDILEQFFKQSPAQPSPGERWSNHERQRLSSIATQHFDAARAQGLIGRDLLWRRDQRRIANDLQTLLDEDDRHRAAHQAREIASELVFGELPDSKASVDLRLADGSVIRLRGMIDRVDRSLTDGRLMVIDYKTGSEYPKGEELEQDAIIGGQYLQLPIYAHAARQVYELDEEEIVRSAYWYITERGDFTYNAVEWNAENTKRFQWAINLIIENIRAGRFPANPGDAHHRSRGQHCMFCSFDAICPVDRRRHWQNIQAAPQLADYLALSEPPEKRA